MNHSRYASREMSNLFSSEVGEPYTSRKRILKILLTLFRCDFTRGENYGSI
jgi:hypothetical protein